LESVKAFRHQTPAIISSLVSVLQLWDVTKIRPVVIAGVALRQSLSRTCADGQGTSLHLVAHLADRFRRRSNEPHAGVHAGLGEVRALRQEAVARVDGVHVVVLGRERGVHAEKVINIHYIALYRLASASLLTNTSHPR